MNKRICLDGFYRVLPEIGFYAQVSSTCFCSELYNIAFPMNYEQSTKKKWKNDGALGTHVREAGAHYKARFFSIRPTRLCL